MTSNFVDRAQHTLAAVYKTTLGGHLYSHAFRSPAWHGQRLCSACGEREDRRLGRLAGSQHQGESPSVTRAALRPIFAVLCYARCKRGRTSHRGVIRSKRKRARALGDSYRSPRNRHSEDVRVPGTGGEPKVPVLKDTLLWYLSKSLSYRSEREVLAREMSTSSAAAGAVTAGPFAPSAGRHQTLDNASSELLKLSGDATATMAPHQPGRASAYQTGQPQPGGRLRARSIGKPATASTPSNGSDLEERPPSPSSRAHGVAPFDLASSTAGFPRPSLNAQGRSKSIVGETMTTGAAALSALARQRADSEARRVKFSDRAYEYAAKATGFGRSGGGGGEASSSTEGTGTEESGSTQSDSPPHTPRDYHSAAEGASGSDEDVEGQHAGGGYWVIPPSRRGSTAVKEEREAWRTGGEPDLLHYDPYDPAHLTRSVELPTKALPPMDQDDLDESVATPVDSAANRNRSKSLEGLTRMSLRRGKSFTSLLVQPVTPSPAAVERRDPFLSGAADRAKLSAIAPTPILAQFENPAMGDGAAATLYPPATGLATGDSIATRKSLRDFVPQLGILLTLFLSSFVVIALTIATLPGLFLPHSVSDLPALTNTLTTYRASSFTAELHLFVVLTLLFLWKQCFSIPGSILTNILFGALYGTTLGTWWACLWTATGSTGAYLIAVVIAPLVSRPLPSVPRSALTSHDAQVEYYFAKPLDVTRRALKLGPPVAASGAAPGIAQASVAPPTDSDLFSHLLLARFFPLLPYSVLNVSRNRADSFLQVPRTRADQVFKT